MRRWKSCSIGAVARLIGVALLASPAAIAGAPPDAEADIPIFRPHDVPSLFFIAKSENKNQVHYAIHLDAACAPVGTTPAFAYWRMRARGPNEIERLTSFEEKAYGIASQQVTARGDRSTTRLSLRALSARPVVVETWREGDKCAGTAALAIAQTPAHLTSVFAQLKWPFGVDYLVLEGSAVRDGSKVVERVAP